MTVSHRIKNVGAVDTIAIASNLESISKLTALFSAITNIPPMKTFNVNMAMKSEFLINWEGLTRV
jgi:hypothetical protein